MPKTGEFRVAVYEEEGGKFRGQMDCDTFRAEMGVSMYEFVAVAVKKYNETHDEFSKLELFNGKKWV